MHFYTIPACVGGHDGRHALSNGVKVSLHMNVYESLVADYCVVLVDSVGCASITNKMLCTSGHLMAGHNMISGIRGVVEI